MVKAAKTTNLGSSSHEGNGDGNGKEVPGHLEGGDPKEDKDDETSRGADR